MSVLPAFSEASSTAYSEGWSETAKGATTAGGKAATASRPRTTSILRIMREFYSACLPVSIGGLSGLRALSSGRAASPAHIPPCAARQNVFYFLQLLWLTLNRC